MASRRILKYRMQHHEGRGGDPFSFTDEKTVSLHLSTPHSKIELIDTSWLAHLASIVTIMSSIFAIFTQQLLAIKFLPVTNDAQEQPGNVPRIEAYTNYQIDPG